MALGDSRAAAEPLQCVGRELLEERVAAENILANHRWKSIYQPISQTLCRSPFTLLLNPASRCV